MLARGASRLILCVACLGCLLRAASAADVENTLLGMPSYQWYYGCGPTAGGMLVGFWDGQGYGDLIDGSNSWAMNQGNVKSMIASADHVADYWGADAPEPWHDHNCVADFMLCSRDPRADGASYENQQHSGLVGYARYRGYSDAVGGWQLYPDLWGRLVHEIDAGRPMEFFVDPTGDGTADHFVTAWGYRYDGSDPANATQKEYCLYDPNYLNDQKWAAFGPVSGNTDYAIRSGSWFDPYDELPVAVPGGPYVLDFDAAGIFSLDGSGSYDTDGQVAQYSWDLDGDGLADVSEPSALIELEGSMLDFLGWQIGEQRQIVLQVTDDQGAVSEKVATSLTYAPGPAAAALLLQGLPFVLMRRRRRIR